MSAICQLIKCDSWQIFTLQPSGQGETGPAVSKLSSVGSWQDFCQEDSRVASTFLTGISYYDADEQQHATGEQSELIIPVFKTDKVCAVLKLLNKRYKLRCYPLQRE